MTDYKLLQEQQDKVDKELKEIYALAKKKWDVWYGLEKDFLNKFIAEKKYLPLSELSKYVGKDREIKEITLVLTDGTCDTYTHPYDIEWDEKYGFSSGVGDDGYYFNVKNEEVLGFFNLQLVPDKEYIKETTRSYLVGIK